MLSLRYLWIYLCGQAEEVEGSLGGELLQVADKSSVV